MISVHSGAFGILPKLFPLSSQPILSYLLSWLKSSFQTFHLSAKACFVDVFYLIFRAGNYAILVAYLPLDLRENLCLCACPSPMCVRKSSVYGSRPLFRTFEKPFFLLGFSITVLIFISWLPREVPHVPVSRASFLVSVFRSDYWLRGLASAIPALPALFV